MRKFGLIAIFSIIATLVFGSVSFSMPNWEKVYQTDECMVYVDNNSIVNHGDGIVENINKTVYRKNIPNVAKAGWSILSRVIIGKKLSRIVDVFVLDNQNKLLKRYDRTSFEDEGYDVDSITDVIYQHCIKILKNRGTI